jgi:hypothetical protein
MEARQRLVNQQHNAIESVVDHERFSQFRQHQLNFHTKSLRNMLGPLLDTNASRGEAGILLGAIVIHTWNMSVKMNTSHLTFQIFFPETAVKFSAATMNAKDHPGADMMQFQLRQCRVKLVLTPVITLRDDRGSTIRAKSMLHADVLLME